MDHIIKHQILNFHDNQQVNFLLRKVNIAVNHGSFAEIHWNRQNFASMQTKSSNFKKTIQWRFQFDDGSRVKEILCQI